MDGILRLHQVKRQPIDRATSPPDPHKVAISYSGSITKVVNDVNLISEHLTELALYCAWFPLFKDNQNFTYGRTLLAVAKGKGNKDLVDLLVARGAKVQ